MSQADDICICGHDRDRHAAGHAFCMGGRMDEVGWERCFKFRLDQNATALRRAEQANVRRIFAKIDRAAAFVDNSPRKGWPASALMTISYCILATSQQPDLAEPWLDELLEDARERHAAGRCADPFYTEQSGRVGE